MNRKEDKNGIVRSHYEETSNFIIAYTDINSENHVKKLERALSKFFKTTYKDLIFHVLSELKQGVNHGELIKDNTYKYILKTESSFRSVHGDIVLVYEFNINNKTLTVLDILPSKTIIEYYMEAPKKNKDGLFYSDRDRFKMEMLKRLGGK